MTSASVQPASEVSAHERVVAEVGVLAEDAVDLARLSGPEPLVRIEAPDALEQALAAQHLGRWLD